jgi:hypothetical protein
MTAMEAARWPNLFVVGAPKAGTTALWRYLGEHPDIFMSPLKEPRYFVRNPRFPSVDDEETYLDLFAGARDERYRGEASASYLMAEHAPEAIRRASPEARIVISLRDPVDQAHAAHLNAVNNGFEKRSFLEGVRDGLVRTDPSQQGYLWDYPAALRRYIDSFGDRVIVLFFEELAADTRAAVRGLLVSLDLDPTFADRLDPTPHNPFVTARGRILRAFLTSQRARRAVRAVVPYRFRDSIYSRLVRAAPKPEPEPEAVRLLTCFYADQVMALPAMLGRPLPMAWERRFPTAACPRNNENQYH